MGSSGKFGGSSFDQMQLAEKAQRLIAKLEEANQAYFTFKPRPDCVEAFDEQESFINEDIPGVAIHRGGNGCLHPDEPLTDCVTGETRAIKDWDRPFNVETWNPETGEIEIGWSTRSYQKGRADLLEVHLSNGEKVVCTAEHQFACLDGVFRELRRLRVGDRLLPAEVTQSAERYYGQNVESIGQLSSLQCQSNRISASGLDCPGSTISRSEASHIPTIHATSCALRQRPWSCLVALRSYASLRAQIGFQLVVDCLDRYFACLRQYGEQLRVALSSAPEPPPLPIGVLEHTSSRRGLGGRANRLADNQTGRKLCLPSTAHVARPSPTAFASVFRGFLETSQQWTCLAVAPDTHFWTTTLASSLATAFLRFPLRVGPRQRSSSSSLLRAMQKFSCGSLSRNFVSIDKIVPRETNYVYYDITTYPHHNYVHKGAVHHNSGTTTAMLRKAVLFMLHKCPPPRKDTPFWFITPNYEIGIKTLWKEKLLGRGHLPSSEIDFNRISWFEKKTELPISVPLKPWPRERRGHPQKNWMIEFKSWMSGREALQGASIGGFGCSEQIPWSILQEIYTRCRDMHVPGSMMYEFTPVDPALTAELESIEANGKLPRGWKTYRSSTARNVSAGHVSAEWFGGFSGAISEEMLETRTTGAYPVFEGVIYPGFRPQIHGIRTRQMNELLAKAQRKGCVYRRSIDWGTGREHPFVCYDDQTEFLSSEGWKKFSDVGEDWEDLRVATVGMDSQRLEFQKPTAFIRQNYTGPMVTSDVNRRCGLDFSVTPNHKMVVSYRGRWRKLAAGELLGAPKKKCPVACKPESAGVEDEFVHVDNLRGCKKVPPIAKVDMAKFIGLYLAEGCSDCYSSNYRIRISQKDRKGEVENVLSALPFKFHPETNDKGVTQYHIFSKCLLSFFDKLGIAYKKSQEKFVPRECFEWGHEAMTAMLEGLFLGDGVEGYYNADGKWQESRVYSTTSKQLGDNVQELAIRLGYSSKVRKKVMVSGYTKRPTDVYLTNVSGLQEASYLPERIKEADYEGNVYCFTVPNGTLIVRRNGRPMICGNCLFGARDTDGRWYIYDEVFSEETMINEEMVSLVMNKQEWPSKNPAYGTTYADPSRPDLLLAFARHCSITAANNKVYEGIESVRVALKTKTDGMPGLIIDAEKCPNLMRQLRGYRWRKSPQTGLNPQAATPVPLKRDDDAPDALRYLIHSERRLDGDIASAVTSQREVPSHLLAAHRWN